MRLRLPSRASSWAKTAAKPAVRRRATGTRAPSSRFLAERHLAIPWLSSISSTREAASERERRSWPVTASRRLLGSESVWIGLA